MRSILLILLVVAAVLYVWNPDTADFSRFAEEQSRRMMERETGRTAGGGALGQIVSDMGSRVAGDLAVRATVREDYHLFSTYVLDFDGPDQTGNEWRFLGVAGRFIELERPDIR